MRKSIALTAALATAVAAVTTFAATTPASATSTSVKTSTVTTSSSKLAYSDKDVLSFLASGRGPLAEQVPQLQQYVPSTESELTPAQLDKLLALFTKADPQFHRNVTVPLQSGDPYKTLAAVKAVEKDTSAVSRANTVRTGGTYTGDCATVLAVALAFYVVLGVVLWVPAAVTPKSSDPLTDEAFAAKIAAGFDQ